MAAVGLQLRQAQLMAMGKTKYSLLSYIAVDQSHNFPCWQREGRTDPIPQYKLRRIFLHFLLSAYFAFFLQILKVYRAPLKKKVSWGSTPAIGPNGSQGSYAQIQGKTQPARKTIGQS